MILTPHNLPRSSRHRAGAIDRLLGGRSQFTLGGLGCNCCGGGSGCSVTICVKNCSGAAISGVTVSISSTPPVNGTTGGGGCVALDVTTAGTYAISFSASGYVPFNTSVAFSCNNTFNFVLVATGSPTATFNVTGCCNLALPGATLTIDGGTYTTDASGNVVLGIAAAGSYPWTVSKARFSNATGTLVVSTACGTGTGGGAALTEATGYHCGCNTSTPDAVARPDPLPTTLHLTDSVYGTTTLTYSGGAGGWVGTLSVTSIPVLCCPALPVTITYTLSGDCSGGPTVCIFTIAYTTRTSPADGCPGAGTAAGFNSPQTETDGIPYSATATVAGNHVCTVGHQLLYNSTTTITITE